MEKTKMVRVVATERGHDGVRMREPGDEFDMPESVLNHVVPLRDAQGKLTGEMEVRKASWFEAKAEPESAPTPPKTNRQAASKRDDANDLA